MRDNQAGQHRERGAPAEEEQGGRGDMLADGGFQLRRNLGHGRDLHEVEIIKQADPRHTKEQMEPAEHRVGRHHVGMGAEHHHNREQDARCQHHMKICKKFRHGFPQESIRKTRRAVALPGPV
jgi:hypothetical protein